MYPQPENFQKVLIKVDKLDKSMAECWDDYSMII